MYDEPIAVKRNLAGPLVVLGIVLVVLGVGAWWVLTSWQVRHDIALVAVTIPDSEGDSGQWWAVGEGQGEASRRFVMGLKAPMEEVGFSLIDPGNDDHRAVIDGSSSNVEDLISRARRLGAGVLIHGTLKPSLETVVADSEAYELILEGDVEVLLTDQDKPDPKVIPMRQMVGAADRQDAIRLAANAVADFYFDEVAAAIMSMPEVDRLFDKATRTPEQAKVAVELKPARNMTQLYFDALRERDAQIAAFEKDWKEQDAGDVPIQRLSPFGREDYLVGVLPNGEGVVATVKMRRLYWQRRQLRLTSVWLPERLDIIGRQREQSLLYETYNIYGVPARPSRDGGQIGLITDDHGDRLSLRGLTRKPGGVTEEVKLLHSIPNGIMTAPLVSPDGVKIAFLHRTCKRCNNTLNLISASGDDTPQTIYKDHNWGVGYALWVGPRHDTIAYVAWGPDRDRKVLMKDLKTNTETVLHRNNKETGNTINESFSPDGSKVVFVRGGNGATRQLVVRDIASGEETVLVENVFIKRPAISFDNRWVAFEATGRASPRDRYRRDYEIAVVPIDGGEMRYLTVNDLKDRHLQWAPDRLDIYFETVIEKPLKTEDYWVVIRTLTFTP